MDTEVGKACFFVPIDEGRSYVMNEDGIGIKRQAIDLKTKAAVTYIDRLTNFGAMIRTEVTVTDGFEEERFFEVACDVNGTPTIVPLKAQEFDGMSWVSPKLGAAAVIFPRNLAHQHVAAAIKLLSVGKYVTAVQHSHTGWIRSDGKWHFLHSSGAIGPGEVSESQKKQDDRPTINVNVNSDLSSPGTVGTVFNEQGGNLRAHLPDHLSAYDLPSPQIGSRDAHRVILEGMELLTIGKPELAYLLFSAVWRATLGNTRFGIHLFGTSGKFKTEAATLAQQFFGKGLDTSNLPANWSSTPNAIEAIAFTLKDTIAVVDDFAPGGTQADVRKSHRDADRILRASGNGSGRSRATSTGGLRPGKRPRALIIGTGEEIPEGQSLRARMITVAVKENDIKRNQLDVCQKLAREGVFAQVTALWLQWLAPRYEETVRQLESERAEWRQIPLPRGVYRRSVDAVNELIFAFDSFLVFAEDHQVLTKEEATRHYDTCLDALHQLAYAQAPIIATGDPVEKFMTILGHLFASRQVYVAYDADGSSPTEVPEAWGWSYYYVEVKSDNSGTQDETKRKAWKPNGRKIGYLDFQYVYLLPEITFAEVSRVANQISLPFDITLQTLEGRLVEAGIVIPDQKRNRIRRRKSAEGIRQAVLQIPHHFVRWIEGERPRDEEFEDDLREFLNV